MDEEADVGLGTTTVSVNDPPVAHLQANPTSGPMPLSVDFDAGTSTDADGNIVLYEFDWHGDGTYDLSGTSTIAQHTYAAAGNYNATLRMTDDKGAQDTDSVSITVTGAGVWHVVTVTSDGNVGMYPAWRW